MKRTIILYFAVAFAIVLQAQKPNPSVANLFSEFGNMGVESTYAADSKGQEYYLSLFTAQKSDMHNLVQYNRLDAADFPFQLAGTKEYIDSQIKEYEESQHLDSLMKPIIKHVLDSLASMSRECYHYEVHNGDEDTVKYVIAMNRMSKDMFQKRVNGSFDTESGNEFIDYFRYNRATSLLYHLPALQKTEKVISYSIDSLHQSLVATLNQYNAKKYPVNYEIDAKEEHYLEEWYILDSDVKDISRSVGTHYYLPLTRKTQSAIIQDIVKVLTNYVTEKSDTSDYHLFYTIPLENAERKSPVYDDLVFYGVGTEGKHLSINMKMTDNGLHVLLLRNEGEWLVPRLTWMEIKSIKGDKIVYEKEFKNDK